MRCRPVTAPDPGISRLVPLSIPGPAGPLEGLLQEREHDPARIIALVCHPHPLYGGTLHNKVVHRAASTLHQLGVVVLRFNYRGVGTSAGRYDEGAGELEDARSALRWLEARHPEARRWLVGFSFGAWVAARLAASEPAIERVVMIAPGVRTSSFESMRTSTVPKLVIQGTGDDICPLSALELDYPTWSDPKELAIVEGGTHFFDRQLSALGDALAKHLEPLIGSPA